MKKTIALLPGDGIGPEVIAAAVQVLQDCAAAYGHEFVLEEYPIGGAGLDRSGSPLPEATLGACRQSDAILFGAVGGPRWDALPLEHRPEAGLLRLRRELDLYANLRPIRLFPALRAFCPVRLAPGARVDMEIVRELSGGIYFGEKRTEIVNGEERATDTMTYSRGEIERVARFAFRRAEQGARRLASVDKANVLASSRLWRKTVEAVAAGHPDITVEHLYVDNAAMQLILRPAEFGVVLTSNMFGDILSDEAAVLAGSIGVIPSMSCGRGPSLFEPIHGSAPQMAGENRANPVAAILCAAMMLREAFGLEEEATAVEAAVERTLERGIRTPDIAEAGARSVGTAEFAEHVRGALDRSAEMAEAWGWGV